MIETGGQGQEQEAEWSGSDQGPQGLKHGTEDRVVPDSVGNAGGVWKDMEPKPGFTSQYAQWGSSQDNAEPRLGKEMQTGTILSCWGQAWFRGIWAQGFCRE